QIPWVAAPVSASLPSSQARILILKRQQQSLPSQTASSIPSTTSQHHRTPLASPSESSHAIAPGARQSESQDKPPLRHTKSPALPQCAAAVATQQIPPPHPSPPKPAHL